MIPTESNNCMRQPLQVIEDIMAKATPDTSQSQEQEIVTYFREVFKIRSEYHKILSLNATDPFQITPRTLVRFRCMVQDPGFGNEMYIKWLPVGNRTDQEHQFQFHKFTDHISPDTETSEVDCHTPHNVYAEKQLCYCIAVPGENSWVGAHDTKGNSMPSDAVIPSTESHQAFLSKKHIHGPTPFRAAVIKFYDLESVPKAGQIIEVVGIFEWAFHSEENGTDIQLPCIHAIFHDVQQSDALVKDVAPQAAPALDNLRETLMQHLSEALGGDTLAATYSFLTMLASVHHVQTLPVGKFSVNLCNAPTPDPDNQADSATPNAPPSPPRALARLYRLVMNCQPFTVYLPLALGDLNTKPFYPQGEEHLYTGALQLADHTYLLVDETAMGNGQLQERGIRNIQCLAQVMTDQKLAYAFPYQSVEFATNLKFLVVSEGKSFLPCDCVVPLSPEAVERLAQGGDALSGEITTSPDSVCVAQSSLDVAQIRQYLSTCQAIEYTIPPAVAEMVQTSYVEERRKNAGDGVNQAELSFRLTLAKLLTISQGKCELTQDTWELAGTLEKERRVRLDAFEKSKRRQ
ncbi:hypothetical protein IWQ62_002475 [Dispira parvispora]|uniref:Mini-chromosome maintenance complex-binding protein n=1 Tax=Dispira parvispora TaxID=1520584 RepID=A0A9W8E7F4_9FUNG|nr:hypothetical protein IWQ62_002475 [Dispira parvispora]